MPAYSIVLLPMHQHQSNTKISTLTPAHIRSRDHAYVPVVGTLDLYDKWVMLVVLYKVVPIDGPRR